jgi:hypothetical protein
MNLTPAEAEEALAAIQRMEQRTRRAIANGGITITMIVTGIIWLIGFTCTQFLPEISGYVWIGLSILGSVLATVLSIRRSNRIRSPATAPMVKRVSLFWVLLILYGIAAIAIARPSDGKQAAMFVILFVLLGHVAMGLVFSFSSVWWALPITALALAGYFLLPGIFYLWMAVLGGGGMIALALYIRSRW